MRLDVYRRELAAVVDFDIECDAVAFVEARHAGALLTHRLQTYMPEVLGA